MMKFKTILMLSLLAMVVLKDVLLVNFNNNLLGKLCLIVLTVYSFYHNKMVGVGLTFLYVVLSLNIIEAMTIKKIQIMLKKKNYQKVNNKKVPEHDMGKWRETNCKKGKLLLNGKEIEKDTKINVDFLNKNFKNQLKFEDKKDLCNPCDVNCKDYSVITKSQPSELSNLENLKNNFLLQYSLFYKIIFMLYLYI